MLLLFDPYEQHRYLLFFSFSFGGRRLSQWPFQANTAISWRTSSNHLRNNKVQYCPTLAIGKPLSEETYHSHCLEPATARVLYQQTHTLWLWGNHVHFRLLQFLLRLRVWPVMVWRDLTLASQMERLLPLMSATQDILSFHMDIRQTVYNMLVVVEAWVWHASDKMTVKEQDKVWMVYRIPVQLVPISVQAIQKRRNWHKSITSWVGKSLCVCLCVCVGGRGGKLSWVYSMSVCAVYIGAVW